MYGPLVTSIGHPTALQAVKALLPSSNLHRPGGTAGFMPVVGAANVAAVR